MQRLGNPYLLNVLFFDLRWRWLHQIEIDHAMVAPSECPRAIHELSTP